MIAKYLNLTSRLCDVLNAIARPSCIGSYDDDENRSVTWSTGTYTSALFEIRGCKAAVHVSTTGVYGGTYEDLGAEELQDLAAYINACEAAILLSE